MFSNSLGERGSFYFSSGNDTYLFVSRFIFYRLISIIIDLTYVKQLLHDNLFLFCFCFPRSKTHASLEQATTILQVRTPNHNKGKFKINAHRLFAFPSE